MPAWTPDGRPVCIVVIRTAAQFTACHDQVGTRLTSFRAIPRRRHEGGALGVVDERRSDRGHRDAGGERWGWPRCHVGGCDGPHQCDCPPHPAQPECRNCFRHETHRALDMQIGSAHNNSEPSWLLTRGATHERGRRSKSYCVREVWSW